MQRIPDGHEDRRAHNIVGEPLPAASADEIWASAGRAALVGIFLLAFGTFLYFGRAILLPISAAAIVALTLAPVIKAGKRRGISPWITALLLVLLGLGALSVAAIALAGPISEWIKRAPEIGSTIRQRLSVLEPLLASFRQLEAALFGSSAAANSSPNVVLPIMEFVTPTAAELLLFFATMVFFLVGQLDLRARFVSLFASRESKLRFLRIMNDVEKNLAGYLLVVTMINFVLGAVVALGAWLLGLPNPAIFGALAALLNYVPYIGPATMIVILFSVGLVTFPSLGHALLAPIGFVAITTVEGQFITPTIVGHRITLNPLLIFLALAFWTWMWGPMGTFLATPLLIVGMVVLDHLFPSEDAKLPE